MTAPWKAGVQTFASVLLLGLIVRIAIASIVHRSLEHAFDPEWLGIVAMIAVFAGIGAGERQR